ncbi:MAG: L-rhamnose/proton symporter RhaT [Bacteroidota bacterium]
MGALLGVLLHAIGGFAAGSFYIPFKIVKKWSWESAWLVLGVAAWLITPIVVAYFTVPNLTEVLGAADSETKVWTYLFGALWGIGGLTFGLAMRYLGISLGMTIALGFTAAFGTLIPPIYEGTFLTLIQTRVGMITFIGIIMALVGIAIAGKAGMMKENDLEEDKKQETVEEFDLWKGIIVATVSGILSASFAFGLAAGKPIAEIALEKGTQSLFMNNPVLVWILWGGITTNLIYTLFLNFKNRSFTDYTDKTSPLKTNYFWAALGGVTWYMQFFFYGMGTTYLGEKYEFASWSIHMAFIILFSNLWGLYFKEWKGVHKKTMSTLLFGLAVIILSILMIGLSNTLFG